jgi:flagellar hook-associated protein 2
MAIALPGLASGLNSAELIKSLMQIEAIPQSLLLRKAAATKNVVSAFQALNTRVAALAETATAAGKADALRQFKATSTSDAVKATTSTGAVAGTIDLTVTSLAQSQSGVSAAMTGWTGSLALTIVGGDGTTTEVTAASASIDDVVTAINRADAGVGAIKVAAGVDGDGTQQYRLQFTGAETGADAAFSIYQGTAAEVAGDTATDLLAAPGSAVIRSAKDAELRLWAGTDAEQTISSATNTFSDLLPGVSVTVAKTTTDPVSVSVARDSAAATTTVKGLVTALREAFAAIDTRATVTDSTDSAGNPIVSGGVFTGDSTVRAARQALLSAATMPLAGRSPSEIGLNITKNGNVEFDEAKFTAALAADPAMVESAVATLATRVADAAKTQSDPYKGVITAKISGQESLVKNLNTQADAWDQRLATRQSTLERTYAALEVRMSALNSQSSWLSSQIASLPTYGGNEK